MKTLPCTLLPVLVLSFSISHASQLIKGDSGKIVKKQKIHSSRFTTRLNSMGLFSYAGRVVSDNPSFHPYNINAEDVVEMWQAQVVISRTNTQQRWNMHQLTNIVSDLQEQVTSLKKRMN